MENIILAVSLVTAALAAISAVTCITQWVVGIIKAKKSFNKSNIEAQIAKYEQIKETDKWRSIFNDDWWKD